MFVPKPNPMLSSAGAWSCGAQHAGSAPESASAGVVLRRLLVPGPAARGTSLRSAGSVQAVVTRCARQADGASTGVGNPPGYCYKAQPAWSAYRGAPWQGRPALTRKRPCTVLGEGCRETSKHSTACSVHHVLWSSCGPLAGCLAWRETGTHCHICTDAHPYARGSSQVTGLPGKVREQESVRLGTAG